MNANLVSNSSLQRSQNNFERLKNLAQSPNNSQLAHNGNVTTLSQQKLCDKEAEVAHTSFQEGSKVQDTVTLSMGGTQRPGFQGMQDPTYFESISKLRDGSMRHCRAHNKNGIDFSTDMQCVVHRPMQ